MSNVRTNAALPVVTYSVDQNFFVESLGGPWNSRNYLNRFPNTVYNKAIDSHLVIFLYALLGPSGAGLLREQYLLARLQIEEAAVTGSDLDSLYSSPFQFARLAQETYIIDAEATILPSAQRQEILAFDAAFRNRAASWLGAIRAGGTVLGITLAASSGLSQPVEVVENYKALYDQFCDIPLGLSYQGSTASLNEIILLPRNDTPASSQQDFVLTNEPVSGYFSITLPMGPAYFTTNVSTGPVGGDDLTVSNSSQFNVGVFVTLATPPPFVAPPTPPTPPSLAATIHGVVDQIVDSQTVSLVDPITGAPLSLPANTSYVALVGYAQTPPIPYNATYDLIQEALQSLPVVGGGVNIQVTGGPLPDQPVNIVFTGALANILVAPMEINVNGDQVTGIGFNPETPLMLNNYGNPNIGAYIVETKAGAASDGLYIHFAPGDVQAMLYAVDILKPATSFVTTNIGQSITLRQPANNTFAGTNYTEVLRYVTGSFGVPWPAVDGRTNWIESGAEHEAPAPASALSSQYICFHNVVNTIAYKGVATQDTHYQNPSGSPYTPWYLNSYDVHSGSYNQAQMALYPFLAEFRDSNYQFLPSYAINPQPDRPVITGVVGDPIGLINNTYPASYLGLPGVQQPPLSEGHFWSSDEQASGVDYLEIDLGTVQAVNYLYFEGTNKPFVIDVAYDLMDQEPQRIFQAATLEFGSITSLNYQPGNVSPWTPVSIGLTNPIGQMIYTRFIRIGFTRNPNGPPFQLSGIPPISIPYSIEVRNLRVGRNVVSGGVSGPTTSGLSTSPIVSRLTGPTAAFTVLETQTHMVPSAMALAPSIRLSP